MNMNYFFGHSFSEEQKHKIKCIMHYFEKICSSTPSNLVSFERKVLSLEKNSVMIALPTADFWSNSVSPLCKFKVFHTGRIEDHQDPAGSLEVDFADKYLGGIVLTDGCLQEEIRFVFNPELIAGMLFLPRMSENEAIEIVGAERFSNYKGYDLHFQYDGDHVDERGIDAFHRRMSRVIAIDALERPGESQYQIKYLLREVNKAFCGFVDHFKPLGPDSDAGIVTGNWGCGVFGGDPELKSIIQWIAASQASRPFISYYTFGLKSLKDMDEVVEFIVSQKWTVGDLWKRICDYGSNVTNGGRNLGFFSYLISSKN